MAQVLHVRLTRGVPQHRGPAGRDRRHQRVLGGGDARLIEEDVRPGEALRLDLVRGPHGDVGAQLLQGEKVGIDAPPPDHIAPRRRQRDPAEPGEHRAGQQDRRADPGAEFGVEVAGFGAGRVHLDRVRARPAHGGAEAGEELEHRLDVADVRDVVDATGPVGQQRGREDGKRGVLVARRVDGPFEHPAARDAERRRHRSRKLRSGLRARQAGRALRSVMIQPLAMLRTIGSCTASGWRGSSATGTPGCQIET